MKHWTKQEIVELLIKRDAAVERAIVAIYNNQTYSEQVSASTQFRNNRGFNKVHDKLGSYLAKWILSGKKLDGGYLDQGRKIAIFYARQLSEIANSKQNKL